MKEVFDYLETAGFAATVCDRDGIVLYQNALSRGHEGDVVGKNLFDCHNEHSGKMIRHMIETGTGNVMESVKRGKRKLYYRTPWFDADGKVAGLIEFGLPLPESYPVIDHDKIGR